VVRIVNVLTALQDLIANVSFKKYLTHTISSATTLHLTANLRSLEIGTEDGIAAMLSCIITGNDAEKIRVLKLHNIKPSHLPHLKILLKKSGRNLQRVELVFANDKIPIMNQGAYSSVLLP
jgi:2-hydroxy-3-keto-5-methylthiopentenyl-1-phosphate phosphatase